METIHKKNGRLHIYVRQDKYKGELKSHNWVGRTYIDGKQKIVSSGTTDLEQATVILEKWYDDLHANKSNDNDVRNQAALVKSFEKLPQEDIPDTKLNTNLNPLYQIREVAKKKKEKKHR